MESIYHITHINSRQKEWWKEIPEVQLECFPWGKNSNEDYRPVTSAHLGITTHSDGGESLSVYMETNETNLRIQAEGFGHVHTDSCMEFFLSPSPDDFPKYMNFEFNPAGAMYLAIGNSRQDRTALPLENYRELFQVKTNVYDKGWNLEWHIPVSFLRQYFPSVDFSSGKIMRGNFYKCGDLTARPHYGCWSPIDLPKPDFHNPAFFGTLVID
jgi:hypothetical protein